MVFTQNYLGPNIYRCFPIDNNKKTAISINKKKQIPVNQDLLFQF
ncbi:hypothetical protein SbBS512_E0978 [Shigella boydii CDC 3083-94]|uniref:Uncharacterized protein n=1 Tax=Shigella boydii serotype 18 (strain CDC 3083-94 / BS512) TaxID=344609 RepID=B2TWR8_SHIB3|nr:hypothetical protein SbBS512_E0978 [Shigella boydii CDC 3083-94]EFW55069.1 hypothetical protein SGB_02672 [Shigella boydii ATCC 9905]EGI96704.1 hypothetical protein SD15574_2308 [Shigella dysenteriae 155-74]